MKKLKYLVLLLALVLVMPFAVYAEGEEGEGEPVVTSEEEGSGSEEDAGSEEAVDQRAVVYFFRGEGCPHCQDAEDWFATIQEEYGEKFVIKDYETWKDQDNSKLMVSVAQSRNEYSENFGVPYIIIGDQSWIGFSEAVMADEIKSKIDEVFAQPVNERHDALAGINTGGKGEEEEKKESNDVVGLIVILVVAGGIGFGIFKARQSAN